MGFKEISQCLIVLVKMNIGTHLDLLSIYLSKGKMSNVYIYIYSGIIGCKDIITSPWHLIGFPDGSKIESKVS